MKTLSMEDIYHIYSYFFIFSEANPEKFNSRFRNKMFYAGVSVFHKKPKPFSVLSSVHAVFK